MSEESEPMEYIQKVALDGHTDLVRKVVQVDSYGTLVTVSNDTTVKFWDVKDEYCLLTSTSHTELVQDVAVLHENAVVTVSDDMTVVVTQVSDGAELASHKFTSSIQTVSALNSSTFSVGDKQGNIFKLLFNAANNTVKVVDGKADAHEESIFGSYAHGGTFATASFDNTVKLWNTDLLLLHTFSDHNSWAMCVAYNKNFLVSGSADNTVRIYSMNDFAHVEAIRRKVTSGFGRIMCVAISEDSKIVVSGGDDQVIMLHSLPSGEFIAKYNVKMFIYDICIMSDGHLAVVGQSPEDVKVFKIDGLAPGNSFDPIPPIPPKPVLKPPVKKLSYMEDALMTALKDPKKLDIAFIEKHIRKKYIKSAADLFCGHNLVLLAVRSQVLTREHILKFKGNLWYFQDNLYYPASQLTKESSKLLYPIFHHAQDIGIIQDGHKYRVNHEERRHTEKLVVKLEESVMELSRRMNRIEDKVETFEGKLNEIQNQVEKNTENFQSLFSAIKKKEKFMQYAGGAKIVLSLIPFVGNALANSAYEVTNAALSAAFTDTMLELGANADMVPEDMIKAGAGVGKNLADSMVRKHTNLAHAQVDLSDMSVAFFMLSARGMSTMDENTQDRIKKSVAKTEFGDIETLRIMLKTMMRQNAKEDVNIARLDAGDSLRPTSTSPSSGPTGTGRPNPIPGPSGIINITETKPEESAMLHFRAKAAGSGSKTLPMHEASDALTQALKTLKVRKQVSEDEFDDMFMNISSGVEVSEKHFLEIFKQVVKDVPLNVDEDKMKREFADIFQRNLSRNSTYRKSARVLYNAVDQMKKEGKLRELKLVSEEKICKMFKEWDQDKDGKIDVDEFTAAAVAIVRGEAK